MRSTTITALENLISAIDSAVTDKVDLNSISPTDVGDSIDSIVNTITNGEVDNLEDKVIVPNNYSITVDTFGNLIIITP